MEHNKDDRQMKQLQEKAEQQLHHAEQVLKTAGHDFQEKAKASGEHLKAASQETGQQLKAAGAHIMTASHDFQEKTGQQLKAAGEQLKVAGHDLQEKAGQQLKNAGRHLKEAEKSLKGSMKGFFKEFKAFALKGNVMDLAIGVMIGGAFQSIVSALTENLINPLIGLLFQMNLDGVGLTVYFWRKDRVFRVRRVCVGGHQLPHHGFRSVLPAQAGAPHDGLGQKGGGTGRSGSPRRPHAGGAAGGHPAGA